MKKPFVFIGINIAIIVGLSIVQVIAANSISTTGIQLSRIEDQIASVKKENTIIREQVLTLSALTTIASEASEMGFVQSKSPLVVTQPLPLARQ
ncbi:MAG TPA: hypothetical protein VG935_00300 [Patescibacteria group bacterium]|nr:hypothetical protein [Patescibacteria group bacterium]